MRNVVAIFQLLLLTAIVFNAQAAEYEMVVALQLEPTLYAHKRFKNHGYDKVSVAALKAMAIKEASEYFSEVISFSPDEPVNSFVLLQLTYGSYFRMDGYESANPDTYCVSLKYHSNTFGVSACNEDGVEDAIADAFEELEDKEEDLFELIQAQHRKIVWLDAVDKGVIYDVNNKPIKFDESYLEVGDFKDNARAILGSYVRGTGKERINFFKSEDLISVIMISRENTMRHEKLLYNIINRTRKRHRMWPFYLHQAVRVNAPINIIKAIGSKKQYKYDKFLDADGNTPLMNAIWSTNMELARFFIEAGSNPALKNKDGLGLIHYAASLTPFSKDVKILDFVLKQGADINDVTKKGLQPLAMAVMFNSSNNTPMDGAKLVSAFSKRGSSLDIPKKSRNIASSALAQAVYYKDHSAGKRLIELGANVNHHPKGRETPLQMAAFNKDLFFTKELLKAGAKVNVIGPDGKTALHYAYPKPEDDLSINTNKIIRLLGKYGASSSIKDEAGKTAKYSYSIAREAYLEEQRILAHNKRMRELKAEKERLAREEKARRRREAEAKRNESGFNWAKAAAMGVGFVAGGGLSLDAAGQAKSIMGIIQDSQAGVEGASNTMGALKSTSQRYREENAARQQASSQSSSSNARGANTRAINAKDNYLKGRYDGYPSCRHPNVQVNSFCQTANAYYSRYLNTVNQGLDSGKQLYAIHKRAARSMLDMMSNSKNRTTLDINGASNDQQTTGSGGDWQCKHKRLTCSNTCIDNNPDQIISICISKCERQYPCGKM